MGKLGPKELEKVIRCIRRTRSSIVPPKVGFDSGVHKITDDLCLVVSTDPCLAVPKNRFGWLMIHYAASDVAVSGVKPRYCTLNLLGPRGTRTRLFRVIMKQACDAANELDMQIVAGHTGRYEGFDDLVGVCTAYGFASPQEVMTPRNVRPDDSMLCTKPIGLETLVAFSQVRRSPARRLLGKSQVGRLSRMFKFQSCVKEALVLSKIRGVHAMHDVAEGGLVAALNEMAEASDAGFSLDLMKLLVPDEVRTLVHEFQLSADELLSMSSTGTLVAALDPGAERKVLARLSELKIPSRIVGKFTRSKRREVKDQRGVRAFPSRARDPFSKICL